MLKEFLVLLLVGLAIHTIIAVPPVSADTKADKQALFAEKVRRGVSSLGVGKEATVEVRLRDKTKLAGYVSETNASGFTLTDAKTGASVPVAYQDVVKVKGHNLSTGAKIGIGIAIGFVVTALVIYLSVRH
jgi:hypothetical protein